MKTEKSSLSTQLGSFSYRAATQKSFRAEIQSFSTDCLSSGHLTRLQHARLLTQDVMTISKEKGFALQTTHTLTHNQVSNWIHVNNPQLVLLVKKIAKAREQTLLEIAEQEQWQERVRQCLVKLKLNFQRQCETIRLIGEHRKEDAIKHDLNH